MDSPLQCETTAQMVGVDGFKVGPVFRCEARKGHKGHHHLQVVATVHRPAETCGHCDSTKPDKKTDQKIQISFYTG